MCGRARCVLDATTLETCSNIPQKQFKDFQNYQPGENMTPGTNFPVIFNDTKSGDRALQIMTWGLIPSFTCCNEQRPDFFKMFNARLETIDEKPSFQKIAKTSRCVVLLNGYFEWKVSSDTGRKQPYYVSREDNQPLLLAAVYDSWQKETAAGIKPEARITAARGAVEACRTFSIITATSAASSQEELQTLHDRQPVFLCTPSAVDRWLRGGEAANTTGTAALLDISQAPDDLAVFPVTSLMSHVSYQHADCSQRVSSPLKSKRMTDFFCRPPLQSPISLDIHAAKSPCPGPVSQHPSASRDSPQDRDNTHVGKALPPSSPPSSGTGSSATRAAGGSSSGEPTTTGKRGGQTRASSSIAQYFSSSSGSTAAARAKKAKTAQARGVGAGAAGAGAAAWDGAVLLMSEAEQVRRAIAESLKDDAH